MDSLRVLACAPFHERLTLRRSPTHPRLPAALFRGDSDPQQVRRVVATFGNGFLLTGMAGGGDPLEIARRPFDESLRMHVDAGWRLSHFLSFSTDYEVARRYAAGAEGRRLTRSDEHWDTALFTFDLSHVRITDVHQPGVYDAVFPGRRVAMDRPTFPMSLMRWMANHDKEGQLVRIRLVDAIAYLEAVWRSPDLSNALEKARRDKEWLVLPLDPPLGDDHVGATALLDDAHIVCERFVSS